MEATYRDYSPLGVKFFFIYKSLAHPELVGDYVQPFTLNERLAHARQAEQQLGATIPWLVDAMDNRLKRALGDRPNSEFIIDPNGVIVRKRAWSHPAAVRKDLEQLVGTVERVTSEEDIQLALKLPLKLAAPRNVVARIDRSEMLAIVARPEILPDGQPFFAKLRAEASQELLNGGSGELYLGFHLDPLHQAHWNNLTDPLSFELNVPEGIEIAPQSAAAPKIDAVSDADPREFLLQVESWPKGRSVPLTVTYFACVGDTACYAVKQKYELVLQRDPHGGRARGDGAGFWDREQFATQALERDKNGDDRLTEEEVQGLIRPHFTHFDTNHDDALDFEELTAVADWLNEHHVPGPRPSGSEPSAGSSLGDSD